MRFTDYDTRVAAYAVIIDDDRILLTWYNGSRHADPCWTLPGGEVEYGESLEEGVVREVSEETGYHVTVGAPLATSSFTSLDGPRPPRAYRSVRVIFDATITGGTLGTVEIGGSTDRAEWIALDQLDQHTPRAGVVDVAVGAWNTRRFQTISDCALTLV